MPANGPYLVAVTLASIALLLALILVVKLHAFLAMLITSMVLGLAAGMPPDKVLKSIQFGFGDALGFIAVVVGLGAMIGRYLEYSGGGRALAEWLLGKFGRDRAAVAILVSAFLVGLPIFFEVGFIILIPVAWNLARESRRSLLFYGLPMAAALTITHSLVPPHPAPAAAAQMFGVDMGRIILLGAALSVPMAIAAGLVYAPWVARRIYIPLPKMASEAQAETDTSHAPPSIPLVILILLLPMLFIFGATISSMLKLPGRAGLGFLGHPFTALAITVLAAAWFFGARRGLNRSRISKLAAESLAPIGALLCIMGGGGAFKQVIVDCGVAPYAGKLLAASAISPLLVAFIVAAAMRVAQGSATVAIITAAGIVAPLVKTMPGYHAELTMLALCCGGSFCSHVNDAGFWLVNQYFGMTVPQTLGTWTAMKIVAAFVGLGILLVIHVFVR